MSQRGFEENGKIEPMNALMIGHTLDQFVDFVNFSVQWDALTGENGKEENLGVWHVLVDVIKNGAHTLGDGGGVVLVGDVVGS